MTDSGNSTDDHSINTKTDTNNSSAGQFGQGQQVQAGVGSTVNITSTDALNTANKAVDAAFGSIERVVDGAFAMAKRTNASTP